MAHRKPSTHNFQDLEGRTFDRLFVQSYAGKRGDRNAWNCVCVCGRRCVVITCNLTTGHTTSCSCLAKETVTTRMTTHGRRHTPEYDVWRCMHQRCSNPFNKSYADYGQRGITVCKRWTGSKGFANFFADIGPRPSKKHSIERKNNALGYAPSNCVWATKRTQSRNTRRTHWLTYRGRKQCVIAWAEEVGLPAKTISRRIRRDDWTIEAALTTPLRGSKAEGPLLTLFSQPQ